MTPAALARLYAWALGVGLFLEGATLLLLDGLRVAVPGSALGFNPGDARHNLLHVAWGAIILALLATSRSQRRTAGILIVFGVFYALLGVAGLFVDRPFGLLLGPGENAFHLTVGPLALVLGAWSSRAGRPYARSA